MLNLLPQPTFAKVRHEYMLRLSFVTLLTLSFVLIFWLVGLVPAYFHAQARAEAIEEQRDRQLANVRDAMGEESRAMLERIMYATNLVVDAPPSPLEVYEILTDKVTPGLVIQNYSIQRSDTEASFLITISGTSVTRQTLVDFSERVKDDARFTRVDVPISVFVVEKNTPFTMTVTYPYELSN